MKTLKESLRWGALFVVFYFFFAVAGNIFYDLMFNYNDPKVQDALHDNGRFKPYQVDDSLQLIYVPFYWLTLLLFWLGFWFLNRKASNRFRQSLQQLLFSQLGSFLILILFIALILGLGSFVKVPQVVYDLLPGRSY